MGLKADFDEVSSVWRRTSWQGRLFLGLSLFLASGSIASLSETITKWKGFFLDALTFYRGWISTPLNEILQRFSPLELPNGAGDACVLFGIVIGANIRIALFRDTSPRIRQHARNSAVFCVLLLGLLLFYERKVEIYKLVGSTVLLAILCGSWYLGANRATRVLWTVQLIAPVLLVCFAAAINAGLSR